MPVPWLHEERIRRRMVGTNVVSGNAMTTGNNRRMTDEEINALLGEYKQSRSQELRDRIVMQYANLVESVARRFAGVADSVEDLIQEGYIGLITAIEGYKSEKGVKFSTYATHFVIGQIKHHLRDRGKIIKEPAWLQELNQRVTRVIEALAQELGRIPTHAEIAQTMGMAEEDIAELLTTREVFKVASLDGGGEEGEDANSSYDMDRVRADRRVELELPVEEKLVLKTALEKLKDLEQTVLSEFYFKERNQTEIARSLGISCNYVSHILRNSTKKLKKILVSEELKEAQIELALMRRRLEEQAQFIEENTVIDPMTRLYNRSYFHSRLEEEINRANRHQYPVAVLLLALDGYERISRAYGTLRAEDILRHSAQLIRSRVRRVDILTRFDTHTFGLILPHTGGQVTVVAERLAQTLGDWILAEKLHTGRAPLNLMIGHLHYPERAACPASLVQGAMDSLSAVILSEDASIAA